MVSHICRVLAAVFVALISAGSAMALTVTVTAPDDLRDDIRTASLSATLADAEDGEAPRPIDILSAAQADYGRIVALLYDRGYFGPAVSITLDGREAASIAPIAAPSAISTVVVTVDPGRVFTFGNLSITPAAPTAETTEGYAPGEVARVSVLRSATKAQIDGWRQAGHAKASVSGQQITARHPDATLNAAVQLDPGPKLRLGRLSITGQSAVREKRIREIAGWPSGATFDPDELDKVETRLRRTGTFASAALNEAETANPDGTLDVTATISDQLPRRYSFGAEYGTLDGFSASALWLHRNIFGGAERLRIEGEVKGVGGDTDGVDFRLGAKLSRPATWRTDLEAFVRAEVEQRDDPNLFARTGVLEFGSVYFASDDREYSYGVGLRRSKTRDDLGERDYTILTFPFTFTFDRRDNPLNATSGYYAQAAITPFFDIEGTENGVVTTLDLRTYRKVSNRVTLAFRGLLGSVAGPDLTVAPADYLFFSGGSGTVRGQDYQSLGVELSPGVTIGGRSFLGLSGEVRVQTSREALSVVAFYDAGYVGAESFIDGSGEWHTGFGAGIRYDTGIGPIRFDMALPGSGPGDSSGLEIYIGIGQAF
ncbi:autotransporter assembly complex family protein [uncultured Tateyamaria sp.]|uniref:autotransporter assembly complex protein TamA n=1 Tax=uncultured Tateyamaria sp. TaxID=455651 RepID=UPI00261C15C9|nr:BamA/TamA family outer membrane protein [uncultured Tateyamaria sp.]